MAIKKLNLHHDSVEHKEKKLDWYWAPIYCAIWFLLFYAVAIPSFYNYPKTLLMRNEHQHPDEFIGERAELQLLTLSRFGVKLSGTIENEVLAVNFLLGEIDKIKAQARLDLYDIAVELQYASGQFQLWGMATSYHNVSNVVVKLAPRNVTTASYLLVNAHFDSEAHSPAAGDDGVMIVIMLETLRVISKAEQPLMHPIVFLFNGAEESNLLASHAFITRHKWAQYCKALINLDSAGSGGREILFQSGPNHPWLMKYYKQSVPRPFATTIAEELFQNNFVPSDTDFRIFREYGRVPGLDMAHALNGYVYHTKYDSYANLERRTCQTTGENVLALTWALANAPELENPENYAEGHTVFYDYLGWFVIFYTEQTGVIINITTSVCAVFIICISVYLMSRDDGADTIKQVFIRFSTIVGVQIVTTLVAGGLTFLIAVAIDGIGASECWYSETWLIFGLYFCPMFFAMTLLPAVYMHCTKERLPVLHKFRKSKTFISLFGVTCLVFIMIACLPVGFPYKKDVAAQRVYVLHTTRTFYNEYGFVYRNESGYYVQPVDRRINTLENIIFQNAEPKSAIEADCAAEIFCGLPLYNSRWLNWKNSSRWILASSPSLPIPTQLKLTSKVYITNRRVRYGFSLKSADRVVIYIDPYPDAKVVDWTFDKTPLKNNYSTPYFIYHMYSMTESPLQFWIEVDRHAAANESAALRLGIGAHFQYHESYYTDEFKAFLKRFPEWSYPIHWSASFESRIF
ncbi:PREDICTED: endoplasmic reticulum metallopeptidase 1-like isoform X2 [Rhagoletis zephyria]|uniref:endoplasmic reticulum metallopeptidase 1-like isoform X2 n=1 Tax=Rhagoletis zephyria TaxID=28612 RepID=UPI0008115C79|nr:PREDICTED: endoplasmic reticulum metallopeptidase 1-like isoform X2 [Rhagoletis zephyria]